MLSRRSFLCVSTVLAASLHLGDARAASNPILRTQGAGLEGGGAAFDLAAFDALPQTRIRTTTPWTEGTREFSGVLLRDFLASLHADPSFVRLVALNDYAVEADVREMTDGSALLSTRIDGQPMRVEDKGPVFVMFPFDERPELRHQTYFSRSVWQLTRIELLS